MDRLFGARKLRVALDELPAVKVWDLRAAGLIGRGTGSVVIEAGGSLLTVAVEETPMKNGGLTGISGALDAGGAPKFCGCLTSALSAFGAAPPQACGIAARSPRRDSGP